MDTLEIKNLHVQVEGKEIIKGLSLTVNKGQVHAMMGPNGSGKSTLSFAMMGHPKYKVTKGEILFKGEDLLSMAADERSRKGLFLAFQYPSSIPGVSVANFLRVAVSARQGITPKLDGEKKEQNLLPVREFLKKLSEKMKELKLDPSFASRFLNDGFSGGEKKRMEILQMSLLEPEFAVLDETDSGLDIDALKIVADGVNKLIGPNMGALVITHYQRLLNYIKPHFVHVIVDGRIARSGGPELALELEQKGYDWIEKEPQPVK